MHNNVATRLTSRSSRHECIPVSHICHIACCWWTINWPTSWQLGEQTFYWMDHSWYSSYQMVQGFVHQSDLGGLLEVESFEHSNISLHHPSIDVFMWNSSKPGEKDHRIWFQGFWRMHGCCKDGQAHKILRQSKPYTVEYRWVIDTIHI